MLKRHSTRALLTGIALALAVAGCSVSTSHLGDISTGTDKEVTTPTSSFGPTAEVFAKSQASNLAGKVTVTWSVTAVNVKGFPANTDIKGATQSVDVDADAPLYYHLTPPPRGWPEGSYKIAVSMTEDGKQRDQKTATFTVGTPPAGGDTGGASSDATSSSDAGSTSP